jgi:hypothetical protein
MKGHILEVNIQESSGLIQGDDGRCYGFSLSQWSALEFPSKGFRVDFKVGESGAVEVCKDASPTVILVSKPSVDLSANTTGALDASYAPVPEKSAPKLHTTYLDVPWYRRSSWCSVFLLANVLSGGYLPGIAFVCFLLITGDVYYNKLTDGGRLKTWSPANRVVAYGFAALYAFWIFRSFSA